jgi:hypothetical protein
VKTDPEKNYWITKAGTTNPPLYLGRFKNSRPMEQFWVQKISNAFVLGGGPKLDETIAASPGCVPVEVKQVVRNGKKSWQLAVKKKRTLAKKKPGMFRTIQEIVTAFRDWTIKREDYNFYLCKGEIFMFEKASGKQVFNHYFGTADAIDFLNNDLKVEWTEQ